LQDAFVSVTAAQQPADYRLGLIADTFGLVIDVEAHGWGIMIIPIAGLSLDTFNAFVPIER
jgi:hypothetical protein